MQRIKIGTWKNQAVLNVKNDIDMI